MFVIGVEKNSSKKIKPIFFFPVEAETSVRPEG